MPRVAADPSLVDVSRRADVLRFRSAQAGLANARAAARAGRLDEAIRAYTAAIASSPGSSFLYRELAVVEREHGDAQAALDHFRKAVELDAADAGSLVQIGELLEAGGDLDGAAKAYSAALAVEPNADVQARLEMVRARADVARLPAEYRAIGDTAQVTRGELAALVGVRLAPLLEPDRRLGAVVITDLRNQWAATWIVTVSRAGVMDPFANHTFQPRTLVRRVELAQTVARLLARIAVAEAGQGEGLGERAADVFRPGAEPSGLSKRVGVDRVRRDAARSGRRIPAKQDGERRRGHRRDAPPGSTGGFARHARGGQR